MGTHYERGLALYNNARYDQALKEFHEELAETPGSSEARCLIACCLLALRQFSVAVRFAREAVSLSPDDWFCHHVLALSALHDRGYLTKDVLAIFLASISLNHTAVQNYVRLAEVYVFNSKWREAKPWIERGLSISPENVDLLALSGWCMFHFGQTDLALRQLRESLRIDASNALTHRFLAGVLAVTGDIDGAKDHITLSHQIDARPAAMFADLLTKNEYTSHDLMGQIVLSHGTLYGKAMSFIARVDHFCKIVEVRYGSLCVVLLMALFSMPLVVSNILPHDHQAEQVGLLLALCSLVPLGAFLFVWLIAQAKMLFNKDKRMFLTANQRKSLVSIGIVVAFGFMLITFVLVTPKVSKTDSGQSRSQKKL